MAVDLDLSASLTIVMGNPNEREKPIGSSMACVPVTMALLANATLTILKVGRRKFMIDRDCKMPAERMPNGSVVLFSRRGACNGVKQWSRITVVDDSIATTNSEDLRMGVPNYL